MRNSVEEGVSAQDLVHGRVVQMLNNGGLVYFQFFISTVKGKILFLCIY
jgi:hypothetical protein